MSYSQVFRINSQTIIHEIIEGEAVIINMEMGHTTASTRPGLGSGNWSTSVLPQLRSLSPLPNAMLITQKPSKEVY
jgi:hypothetical protein